MLFRRTLCSVAMMLFAIPGMVAWGGPQPGQPSPDLKGVPLPGIAGEHARAQKHSVRFLSPSEVQVPANRPAELDLRFEVASGFHINSHTPHDRNLVPTRLATVEPEGIEILSVHFPPGEDYAPAFAPDTRLNVYSGVFTLRMKVQAGKGSHDLKAALRYQACDANACLPPRSLPVEIAIRTAK